MNLYLVYYNAKFEHNIPIGIHENVEADRYETEGGVLTFYDNKPPLPRKITSYKDWIKVELVEPKEDRPQKGIIAEADLLNRLRIKEAIELALDYGTVDGDHHKMWVIDQMLRILTGDHYDSLVAAKMPDHEWDTGIAP